MTVKYKVIEKTQPGIKGGGQRKYFASANIAGEVTLSAIVKEIEQKCTMKSSDIWMILNLLADSIEKALMEGKSVHLGKWCNIRVKISSNGMASAEDVDENSIRDAKVVFTQGERLESMLKNISYQKM